MSGSDILAFTVGVGLLLFLGWSLWPARTPRVDEPSAANNWRRLPEESNRGPVPGTPSIPPENAAVPFSSDMFGGVHH